MRRKYAESVRLNDAQHRVNRASNALESNQSVTTEPKKEVHVPLFSNENRGRKIRETIEAINSRDRDSGREAMEEKKEEVCEKREKWKLEGRDSGLVWSGLVWSGLVWHGSLCSSLLDVSSFRRSLIKVQLQVKLKHDDNVAGSQPLPPLRPGKGSFSESGEEAGWNLSGRKQPSKLLRGLGGTNELNSSVAAILLLVLGSLVPRIKAEYLLRYRLA